MHRWRDIINRTKTSGRCTGKSDGFIKNKNVLTGLEIFKSVTELTYLQPLSSTINLVLIRVNIPCDMVNMSIYISVVKKSAFKHMMNFIYHFQGFSFVFCFFGKVSVW